MEPVTWLIYFDDPEMRPEVFAGPGAEQAAIVRVNQLRDNWNVTLFVSVATQTPKPMIPYTDGGE